MSHQGFDDYDVWCHVKNPHQVFGNIDKLSIEILNQKVKKKLAGREGSAKLSELKESLCGDYFKKYFKKGAKQGPVILPPIKRGINKIVDTMERWCREANTSPLSLKGLVVHNFNFLKFLETFVYKLDAGKLCKELEIKDFESTSTPTVIVYNPKESVILLIRKSGEKELSEEMEFCSDVMKIFMLLFGDECKLNGVKVICLLASNEAADKNLKCESCKKLVVPFEALESYRSFLDWISESSKEFNIKNNKKICNKKVIEVSENLIGCLAAAPYFEKIPTFTDDVDEQMKHVLMLLTRQQKDIIYSDEKHLIIRGPYGSGKSVVALKKLEILLKELEENKINKVTYLICHDSKTALLTDIERTLNVKTYCHEGGKKLSELIKDILEETGTENVNLFVDEYNGEDLDKEEAETLNRMFEEKFNDATIVLVPQSMVKERNVRSKEKPTNVEKNMFDLLNMTIKDLDLVMRNPVQIYNLISVTQNVLKEEKTKYKYPLTKPTSKYLANQKNKSTLSLKLKKAVEKIVRYVRHQDQPSTSKSVVANFEADEDFATAPLPKDQTQFVVTNFETEEDFATAQILKDQTQSVDTNFEVDEVFATAKLPKASNDDETVIVNHYRYEESTGIGHNVSSDYPELFELDFQDDGKDFAKLCALKCTFQEMNIHKSNSNNKHVILHFDPSTNGIPELLAATFQYLRIKDQITNNYQDFKVSKSILVCYFRVFRGLEHSNVTVYIDRDMYNMQHYLVEVMARCTNKLSIVVLQRSDALSKIIKHWEGESMEKKLIHHWKVQESTGGKKKINYDVDESLKLIKINCCSEEHEEMQKIFHQYRKRDLDFNRKHIDVEKAEENIRKRY